MQNPVTFLKDIYRRCRRKYQTYKFNRYRRLYKSFTFAYKIRMANKWLRQYPDQSHFDFNPIKFWFEEIVSRPVSVLEIGGWRGVLANKSLSQFEHINLWHNSIVIKLNVTVRNV